MGAFALLWLLLLAASATATSHPNVLSDEANYLLPTLLGYRQENFERWEIIARIPNLLYYRIYATLAGNDIYFAAKLLNAAFVVAAALPAYAIGKGYLPRWQAALFAAVVICAPISTFTRHFMPESMYYFGFWTVIYILLRTLRHSAYLAGLTSGMAVGLLSLVKPHALALAIGMALVFLSRKGRPTQRMIAAAVLALSFYATRLAAGYLLGGAWDLSVTGHTYGNLLLVSRIEPMALLFNLAGHAASLVLLAGLPLAAIAIAVFHRSEIGDQALQDLLLVSVSTLAVMVAMTVFFSGNVSLVDPIGERITRLHGRYYAFALPLTILAFAALARDRGAQRASFSNGAMLGWAFATFSAAGVVMHFYEVGVVDYPELGLMGRWPNGIAIAGAAGLACIASAWWLRHRFGGDRWKGALPIVWFSSIVLSTSLLVLSAPLTGRGLFLNDVDRAMMGDPFAVSLRHRDDGMVVGTLSAQVDTYRVMFYLASLSRGRILEGGAVLRDDAIPPDVAWMILLPGTEYSGRGGRKAIGPLTYVRMR